MVYLYAINACEVKLFEEIKELMDVISEERKDRIGKFYFLKDRVYSLLAEVILRYALEEKYNIKRNQVKFQYTKYGKPILEGYENIHFNISHSGDWVICGVADCQIGIDVEQEKDRKMTIVKDFFSEDELKLWNSHLEFNRKKLFYRIWTLKESYTKNIGQGLSYSFRSISFKFEQDSIQVFNDSQQSMPYYFLVKQLDANHLMSLCVKENCKEEINKNVNYISCDILKEWKISY